MTISLQNQTNKYKTGKVLHADPSRYLSAGTGPRTSRRISKSNQCNEFEHPLRKSELLLLRNPFPVLRSRQSTVAKQPLAL